MKDEIPEQWNPEAETLRVMMQRWERWPWISQQGLKKSISGEMVTDTLIYDLDE